MKALSVMQPWASLIVGGPLPQENPKRIENRTWDPPRSMIGQRFAIHASKKLDELAFHELLDDDFHDFPYRTPREFPRSAIVGVATLAGFIRHDSIFAPRELPADQERWWSGPVAFLLSDVIRIDRIDGIRGALGFWELPAQIEAEVNANIARLAA